MQLFRQVTMTLIGNLIVSIIIQAMVITNYLHAQELNSLEATQNYSVLIMLPDKSEYPFSMNWSRIGIELAFDKVSSEHMLPNVEFVKQIYDTEASPTVPVLYFIDALLNDGLDLVIGPASTYSCASVARCVRHYNVTMVSAGCLSSGFTNKDEYYFTRLQADHSGMSTAMYGIMTKYNWTRIAVFVETNYNPKLPQDCKSQMEHFTTAVMKNGLKMENISYANFYHTFAINMTYNEYLHDILETNLKESRVVFMCAHSDTVRKIMIEAHSLGMINGEYAFFSVNPFDSKYFGDPSWKRENDSQNDIAKEAFRALMTIQLYSEKSAEYDVFAEKVKMNAKTMYDYDYDKEDEEVNSFVTAFHDAVILYALALNETLTEAINDDSIDPRNGTYLTSRMWNRTFEGIAGNVTIDQNGDRDSDYSLKEMTDTEKGTFEVVGIFRSATQTYEEKTAITDWPGKKIPLDEPECGFENERCPPTESPIMMIAMSLMAVILLLFVLMTFYVYRKYTYEKELANTSWKVKWNDITFNDKIARRFGGSRMSLQSVQTSRTNDSGQSICGHNQQIFTVTGHYKGNTVAIKKLDRERVDLTRQVLMELKAMREIQHDHVTKFVGSCVEAPNISILTEYCPKGSLQDILENDSIELDDMFKYSLMYDLVKGLQHLHAGIIHSHGNLKSSNCVVDNRFVLKVTDFGLNSIRAPDHAFEKDEEDSFRYYNKRLWTAPELLRLPEIPSGGTQKGDIYSFGVILQEIMLREGVFYFGEIDLSPEEIITRVKEGTKPPLRPVLSRDQIPEEVISLINKCWEEEPIERLDCSHIRTIVRKLNKGRETGNLVDNLLSRMEQYASNLEDLVEERTEAFYEEKKKAEELLYQILPKPVAEELKKGKPVTAETFEHVTIYFSDIVGFTKLSSMSTPLQVVDLLNDLYTAFDAVIDNFNVYKVETIGDAYMVVSGLPIRNGDYHAREIARMSLALLQRIKTFEIRHRSDEKLKLRIGIHSGPAVAGVVGLKMPRYCLFGDTVNTASRMESNGEAGKIHVSKDTKKILELFGTFLLEHRGEVEMKGKGKQTTYWLMGEVEQNGFKYQEVTDHQNNTLVDDTPSASATNHISQ